MIDATTWSTLRALLYPVMIVGGLAWALGFWTRFRGSQCPGDMWAGRMGAAVALFGALSMAGLVLGRASGYGPSTAPLVTLGVAAMAAVLVWGALRLLVGGWRRR